MAERKKSKRQSYVTHTPETGEILIGTNYPRGTPIPASAVTPRWSNLLEEINEEIAKEFVLVVLGEFYPGEGQWGNTDNFVWSDVVNIGRMDIPDVHMADRIKDDITTEIDWDLVYNPNIDDRNNTKYFVQNLYGLSRTPVKITGFVLRKR